jgi:glycosyltransferase involved in cell wall biosynthesis
VKIAVNTRLLIKDKMEGIALHSLNVLKRITQAHPEHQFLFLFDRPYDEEFIFSQNITPVVLFPQARHPMLFYWWFEHSAARILNSVKPDIFYSPDGFLSLNANVCSLPVIHDINFEHFPSDLPYLVSWYYRYYMPRFVKKASRIITVSEYSKNDIAQTYKTDSDKIDVVYNGISEAFKPLSRDQREEVKGQYCSGKDYFICVSALHPRKNVKRLLLAYDRFREKTGLDVKLLVAGPAYFKNTEMEQVYRTLKFKEDVIFAGRMGVQELARITGGALASVYVSYYEGFGIPVIEAMKCHVPVIISNATSLPEVAGDAALQADPFSAESIEKALTAIALNESLRKELVEKGDARCSFFSWEKTAGLTWESIEKTVALCRSNPA